MAHLLIAAPHKSSGKTTITLALCRALARRGRIVQPFKKGPDYIDPMWLGRAAGRPCYNLDFHTMGEGEIRSEFALRAADADISIVEGNMGFYDSLDLQGAGSNASLAKLLGAPVVLVIDVRGATRSIIPLVMGFQQFDPEVNIAGVILNMVGGKRHEDRLREVFAYYTDIPLLGVVHRDTVLTIDERHLGLVPSNEASASDATLEAITERLGPQLDLDAIEAVAARATLPQVPAVERSAPGITPAAPAVRIGIARDAAFGFYYPSDLDRLREEGAELVEFDALHAPTLPEVDGLFIGGGFPETQMAALEANLPLREAIREAVEAGMPVYAECGGLMYLSRSIAWGGVRCEMVGVVPGDVVMHDKPVGRGYVRLRENGANPWGGSGEFNAHEFHYSSLENLAAGARFAYEVVRGTGIDGRRDGYVYKNLLASYAHLRDTEGNHWARRFVAFVRRHVTGATTGI